MKGYDVMSYPFYIFKDYIKAFQSPQKKRLSSYQLKRFIYSKSILSIFVVDPSVNNPLLP